MKRDPHWVKIFLRELETTGNVRLAAERAGVDFTSAYQRRKRHGEFAEAWESALRLHATRSAQDEREGESAPPSALRSATSPAIAGEDEVVRPDGKVIKGSEGRWGKRTQEAFLAKLTLSANVRHSAKAVGFSTQAVYKRRLKDRHFAAAWDAAIEVGKASVQAYLVEATKRTFDPDELPIGDEREIDRVSISEAINIAKLRAAGPPPPADDSEDYDEDRLKEVRERILDKLKRLRDRDLRELGEAGWVEWDLPTRPTGGDGGTVWLPPDYRLVRDEERTR
jgi:hypothetical protein